MHDVKIMYDTAQLYKLGVLFSVEQVANPLSLMTIASWSHSFHPNRKVKASAPMIVRVPV